MKTLDDLKPGDYVFNTFFKVAYLITQTYECGKELTCSMDAIRKYPKYYRIATEDEIKESKRLLEEFLKNKSNSVFKTFK